MSDIYDAVSKILEYTEGSSRKEFERDMRTQDAVVRRLEIIGEATKCIPTSFRDKHPAIPWRRMAGLRDVLIHGYFGVEIDKVWEVIEVELPKLSSQLTELLDKEKKS